MPLIGTRVCNQAAQLSRPLFMNNYKQERENRKHALSARSSFAPIYHRGLSRASCKGLHAGRERERGRESRRDPDMPRATVRNQVTPPSFEFWHFITPLSFVPLRRTKNCFSSSSFFLSFFSFSFFLFFFSLIRRRRYEAGYFFRAAREFFSLFAEL